MELSLRGRTALVTGANAGIGRCVALMLARQGVRLVVAGRNAVALASVADEIASFSGEAPGVALGDLATADGPGEVARQAMEFLGSCDILINNAGGSRPLPPEPDERVWQESFDLNFHAPRRLAEELIPGMVASRWGRIVNITGAGVTKSVNAAAPAKQAMSVWARSRAFELAPHGITINNIQPGRIKSDQILNRLHPTEESRARFIAENIPMGRFGEPEELAGLVVFLASTMAGYITGVSIPVDGGMYRLAP